MAVVFVRPDRLLHLQKDALFVLQAFEHILQLALLQVQLLAGTSLFVQLFFQLAYFLLHQDQLPLRPLHFVLH